MASVTPSAGSPSRGRSTPALIGNLAAGGTLSNIGLVGVNLQGQVRGGALVALNLGTVQTSYADRAGVG